MENYVGNYFKKTENDFKGFFVVNKTEGGDKIDEYEKKLKELTAQMDEMEGKLAGEYSKKYAQKYTKPSKPVYLCYTDRNSNKHYYALNGQGVDESHTKDAYIYNLDTKSGEVEVLGGFCYDLASVVIKDYKYTISGDNNTVKLKVFQEVLYDFLSGRSINNRTLEISTRYYHNILRAINADEFLSTLYGTPVNINANLDWHCVRKSKNASYETIIKTAPQEIMTNLLGLDIVENMPNYKIIGISKETYNEAIKRGVISEVFALREFIAKPEIFNKTEPEWLDLIDACKAHQEDLQFYDIDCGKSYSYYYSSARIPDSCLALYTLADYYKEYKSIQQYYSFGKYINYVVDGCINQGYTSIRNFVDELKDYCHMCNANKIKPILFSNALKITHDTISRNQKVSISAEDEAKFKMRYADFKPYTKEEFSIIAPSCTNDVKVEGNQMNSCIGGYLKKVIDNICLVFFLRRTDALNESLVSIEIRNGALVQAKKSHNDDITKEQAEFLQKFCEDRGFVYQI